MLSKVACWRRFPYAVLDTVSLDSVSLATVSGGYRGPVGEEQGNQRPAPGVGRGRARVSREGGVS